MPRSAPKPPSPELTLDQALASTVVRCVEKAFLTLFSEKVSAGAPSLEREFVNRGDVSGILGMSQERSEALLVLSFRSDVICRLLSHLYGRTVDTLESSVWQGVGELTNIIYSAIKKELNIHGHSFRMSVPSVIIGTRHAVVNVHKGGSMIIPFRLSTSSLGDEADFHIEITLMDRPPES